jgi:hypothetical protein
LDGQLAQWLISKENNLSEDMCALSLALSDKLQSHPSATYGSTSPQIQYETLKRAVQQRDQLGLGHEVEWTQFLRGYALTRLMMLDPAVGLGLKPKHLNITVLYGFSPRLAFPKSYDEFRDVLLAAKALQRHPLSGHFVCRVTTCIGASVVPQHMFDLFDSDWEVKELGIATPLIHLGWSGNIK